MKTSHLTLTELSQLIKGALDTHLSSSYWVVAEIGELRLSRGHCYLDLIDKEEDKMLAKLRANIWSYSYRSISGCFEAATGQALASGMKVLANVMVQYHELYGLSLNIKDIDPTYTLGERARRRQEIINRLIQDGVYEMNRQLPLPALPQRIAVISSPTAAGWGDFVDQLIRNPFHYRFELNLFKAVMQGEQAAESMMMALEQIFAKEDEFDLVVIIRGGGAKTDLDCFDSYELATYIAQFPLPVLTGIGHERDETIADLVAHTKLKTPTAVAEFLLSGLRHYEEKTLGMAEYIFSYARDYMQEQHRRLEYMGKGLHSQTLVNFRQARLKNEQLMSGILKGSQRFLKENENRLQTLNISWSKCLTSNIKNEKLKLQHMQKTIALLSPENILQRGYSITYINGKLAKKASIGKPGDTLLTQTQQGELISILKEYKPLP